MEMKEKLEFMETLRKEFPTKNGDYFGEQPRCTVGDIVDKLGLTYDEVWIYVSELSKDALIDNNGGELRFNNSLQEDVAEIFLLSTFAKALDVVNHMPIGFVYKVINGMYRGNNFCAGKLASIRSEMYNGKDYTNILADILKQKERSDLNE